MEVRDLDRLRDRLGERIPDGGSDADTLFTNYQLSDLLDRNDGVFEDALVEGWQIKVAEYSNLVDTTEGTSKRSMSDLRSQAQAILENLEANTTANRRTRVHTLGRD